MIDIENEYRTGSATFGCENIDLSLGRTERHTELTSVNNTSFDYELSTSPNPASTTTNVSFVLPVESANYKLKITDNYQNIGSLVYDTEINNLNTKSVTVSNFANGVYTISIFKNDTEVASIQLLVTH